MRISAQSVGIIGGADGPTSVFIASKNEKQSLPKRIKKEVAAYLQEKYRGVEVSCQNAGYLEERRSLKESLILRYKPELLGEYAQVTAPADKDVKALERFMEQMNARSQKAQEVSEKEFPLDFHIYDIASETTAKGTVRVCIEYLWQEFGVSYSGSKQEVKRLKKIAMNLYDYYGVTEEDIREKTSRFQSLVLSKMW